MSPNRVLPYTLLVTIGPSVTAATSLFVIVSSRRVTLLFLELPLIDA